MKVALYIRVSTEEQAKSGFSLSAQETILTREAEKLNATVTKTYIDDGYSAKNMNRPSLKKMIADFNSGTFDAVLFWRLDRLTRKSKDFHKIVEKMSQSNIGMISVNEKIDTTSAIGRFQLELSVSLAQLERETTSERVSQVMEERARKGLRNGAPSALGYKIENKEYLIVQEHAKVVQRIYDLYLTGNGYKKIAHLMIDDPETAMLLNWSGATIKYILQNPLYTGKRRWNYIDSNHKLTGNEIIVDSDHEAIISEEIFERVQDQIKRRAKGGKSFTSDHIFSSVLRCGKCGARMQGFAFKKNDRVYKTYRCSNKIEKGICSFQNTRENGVSEAFLNAIDYSQFDLKSIDAPNKVEVVEVEELRKKLEKLNDKKKRLREVFANELMTLDELKEHLEEIKTLEDKLKSELDATNTESNNTWTKEEISELLSNIRSIWGEVSDKAKKLFLQELFEYLVIDIAPGEQTGRGRSPKLIIRDFKFK